MPTLGNLIDETISTLTGYTTDWPGMGTLTQPIGATDTSLTVDFGQTPGASRPNGIIEIDNELILVSSFNPSTNIITVPTWGRGQRGTIPVAHPSGSKITVRPRYPRAAVTRALNEAILSFSPSLYGVQDTTVNITGIPDMSYPLPVGTFKVLRIEAVLNTAFPWTKLIRDFHVNTGAAAPTLELANRLINPYLNETLQITCATEPQPLVNETDDYTQVTGMPASSADIPVLRACAKLILSTEASRQQVANVEASQRLTNIQPGSAVQIARTWQAMADQRLASEIASLQARYPLTLRREY